MLRSLGSDGMATFEDGTTEGPIDTVIYCTGVRCVRQLRRPKQA